MTNGRWRSPARMRSRGRTRWKAQPGNTRLKSSEESWRGWCRFQVGRKSETPDRRRKPRTQFAHWNRIKPYRLVVLLRADSQPSCGCRTISRILADCFPQIVDALGLRVQTTGIQGIAGFTIVYKIPVNLPRTRQAGHQMDTTARSRSLIL